MTSLSVGIPETGPTPDRAAAKDQNPYNGKTVSMPFGSFPLGFDIPTSIRRLTTSTLPAQLAACSAVVARRPRALRSEGHETGGRTALFVSNGYHPKLGAFMLASICPNGRSL